MIQPLILTAHVDDAEMAPFDRLRAQHFPAERNFLRAHVTLFHHLPGAEHDAIIDIITSVVAKREAIDATVSGIRHLGSGVAYTLESVELTMVRKDLHDAFAQWLSRQDKQGWRPHITVQNKVSKPDADRLYGSLADDFTPRNIRVTGLDLWRYLGGPWRFEAFFGFDRRKIMP